MSYLLNINPQTPNLDFYQEMVVGLIVSGGTVKGVRTSLGLKILAKTVILQKERFGVHENVAFRKAKFWGLV